MENQNLFEGLPSLGDEQGLQNYLSQQAVNEVTPEVNVPTLLQPNQTQAQSQEPVQPQAQPAGGSINVGGVQYTAEQVQQIIANAQAQARQSVQAQQNVQRQIPQAQTQPIYTPQQANIIKQLIDRGVSLDKIQAALNGNQQNNVVAKRLEGIENYLRQQEYATAEQAFIDKMTSFGDKFGLSEDDLVTFANAAYSKGMNLANINDVEAVFRVIYPDQYAIRMQRISKPQASQLYGGTSIQEAPNAITSKMEDAYVESFLKGAMPNQYNRK